MEITGRPWAYWRTAVWALCCLPPSLAYNPQDMATPWRKFGPAIAALLLFFFLALNSMTGDSPTMDEQNHIARGLAYLRTGDPRLSVEHPPLVNVLSALPLLTMPEIRLPLDEPSWERQPADVFWYVFAEQMLWQENRELDIQKIMFLARLPVVYLTMGLALLGWHMARRMWGWPSPLFVLFLLLFDPNILAHGRYVTTDLGGAFFVLLATFLLWELWRGEPDGKGRRRLWAALGIGLAFSSKLSALAFAPIWALQAVLPLYGAEQSSREAALRRLGQLLAAGLAALLVVWLVYGLEWGPYLFLDSRLAQLNQWQGPLPTFLSGIERILLLSEGGRPAFLLGEFSSSGFLLYFPIALLVKTPLLTLATAVLAAATLTLMPSTRARAVFLLVPVAAYLGISLFSALNVGYRHLLPILPFIYLLIGGLATKEARMTLASVTRPLPEGWSIGLLLLLVLALLSVDARLHPHYLSTFNSLAGGPKNGHKVLVDSNIDWGQDLLRLQDWMAAQGLEKVKLGWFGTADPDYYGLSYEPLPGGPRQPFWGQWTEPPFDVSAPPPGIYAISASSLWEYPLPEKRVYAWFREREPDDRVGYSILIYEVP